MKIDLQVDYHPSGNRTLKQRNEGQTMWVDLQEPKGLLANPDMGVFYRQVAKHLGDLVAMGHEVSYCDTQAE
ncbi:hypothetical protein PAERUG_P40_Scotland_4_VIM_2_09_12_04092 [Pseudomonas aeruginosa]|nr:hypothetical protein [Pseudomonas aeruginosa]CRN66541.1 hypothetical protein PAERUG_P40_Scotland_4_VIM_2_09_12_04092 [Pseudomonas aeruginosa]